MTFPIQHNALDLLLTPPTKSNIFEVDIEYRAERVLLSFSIYCFA